jgi:hypothetical protein
VCCRTLFVAAFRFRIARVFAVELPFAQYRTFVAYPGSAPDTFPPRVSSRMVFAFMKSSFSRHYNSYIRLLEIDTPEISYKIIIRTAPMVAREACTLNPALLMPEPSVFLQKTAAPKNEMSHDTACTHRFFPVLMCR